MGFLAERNASFQLPCLFINFFFLYSFTVTLSHITQLVLSHNKLTSKYLLPTSLQLQNSI